jgi:hypothetical protein
VAHIDAAPLVDIEVSHASRKRLVAHDKPDEAKALRAFKAHEMPVLIGEVGQDCTALGIHFHDAGVNFAPGIKRAIDGNESGVRW